MRVVVLGSGGEAPAAVMRALAATCDVAAAVAPSWRPHWYASLRRRTATILRLRAPDPFDLEARRLGIPQVAACAADDPDFRDRLRRLQPDLMVIASFPWILPDDIIRIPRLGTINLHPSLLPRHRGANPYFWIYYRDDRETGITAHRAVSRADAGGILGRRAFALERGLPVETLYRRNAALAAELAASIVAGFARGPVAEVPQDESLATPAGHVPEGRRMIPFAEWPAERVWHVLAGMCPRFREPLAIDGRPLAYSAVTGFEVGDLRGAPGSVVRDGAGFRVTCRDGSVALAGPS